MKSRILIFSSAELRTHLDIWIWTFDVRYMDSRKNDVRNKDNDIRYMDNDGRNMDSEVRNMDSDVRNMNRKY